MNAIHAAVLVVSSAFAAAWFFKATWVRVVCIIVLLLYLLVAGLAVQMGIRGQVRLANEQGAPAAYIDGMIDQNAAMKVPNYGLFIVAFGITILGVAGWISRPKPSSCEAAAADAGME